LAYPTFMGGVGFLFFISLQAHHHSIKINLMAVKFRAIYTDKLHLPTDGHPTPTTHTRAIDHDGVQAHHGVDPVGPGGFGDKLHHNWGPNADNFVGNSGLAQLLQGNGHQVLAAVAAVVGADDEFVAPTFHFFFQNEQVLVSGTHDSNHLVPGLFIGLDDGVHGGNSNSTSYTDYGAYILNDRGISQGTKDVFDRGTNFLGSEVQGCLPDRLENNGDCSFFFVGVGDGQGNSFPKVAVQLQDNKLTGFPGLGYVGSIDGQLIYVSRKLSFLENHKQGGTSFEFLVPLVSPNFPVRSTPLVFFACKLIGIDSFGETNYLLPMGLFFAFLIFVFLSGCVSPPYLPPTDLPLPAPRYPEDHTISNYTLYYGPLTPEAVEKLRYYQLVVLHPNSNLDRSTDQFRETLATIRAGVDGKPGTPDDGKILGYVSVGEDPRAFGYFDLIDGRYWPNWDKIRSDSRFYNSGFDDPGASLDRFSGPRVDPRGSPPQDDSLQIGLPSEGGGGFLRYYLDDSDRVHSPGGADGLPDYNPFWGSLYVNAGDPLWFDELHSRTREDDGFYGIGQMLDTDGLGLDGLFLDTIDTWSPNHFSAPGTPQAVAFEWAAPGYRTFLVRLKEAYPDTYLLQNRGLFFFDPSLPQVDFSPGDLIDGVLFENYRLDSRSDRSYDVSTYLQHQKEVLPDLTAHAQVFGFQLFSLGYIHPQTRLDEVEKELEETVSVGLVPALTNPAVADLHFATYQARALPDTTPPRWTNTAYQNTEAWPRAYRRPLVPRQGIRSARWVDGSAGLVEITYEPALDRSPVTYVLLARSGNQTRTITLTPELNPHYYEPNWTAPAFRSIAPGLDPSQEWDLDLRARDAWGNEVNSRSVRLKPWEEE